MTANDTPTDDAPPVPVFDPGIVSFIPTHNVRSAVCDDGRVALIGLTAQPKRPDACNPDGEPGWNSTDYDSMPVEPTSTPVEFAVHAAAAILTDLTHEVMEFTRVNGVHVWLPHPRGEGNWEWLHYRMVQLLAEYRAEFPDDSLTPTYPPVDTEATDE